MIDDDDDDISPHIEGQSVLCQNYAREADENYEIVNQINPLKTKRICFI
jgi:hypothetical protein